MNIDGQSYRTLWRDADGGVKVIDQRVLPHKFEVKTLATVSQAATAIGDMTVRGAPLIGATAAYGMALAMAEDPGNGTLAAAFDLLIAARPTAVNLRWGLERMRRTLERTPERDRRDVAFAEAAMVADEDVAVCSALGEHGLGIIREHRRRNPRRPVEILTHCNAGWVATVDWGTALAPIYKAHRAGIPVHVWVDETRPRNQGASLTAYELAQEGVPHTIVVDNVGGHLMQHGRVDLCIVGTDRTTRTGDVCNKIGTYLKALAASDNNVPFYVALPSSTIDWRMSDGVAEIPIEERSPLEVTHISGVTASGSVETVRITPDGSPALNYGFDVTPARLVTGLITESGICPASEAGLLSLFPAQEAA